MAAMVVSSMVPAVAFGAATAEPVAGLAKRADAICRDENKLRVANPHPAPTFRDPVKATAAQIKAGEPYLARDLAITRDEVKGVFALGTPSETTARNAWNRLHALLVEVSLPAFAKAVQDMKSGDGKLVAADFARSGKYDAEQVKLQKTLGLKVCGNG